MQNDSLPVSVQLRLEEVCDRFEAAWKAGPRPRIEDYLSGVAERERPALLGELILLDITYRQRQGECPVAQEYQDRFGSAWTDRVTRALADSAPGPAVPLADTTPCSTGHSAAQGPAAPPLDLPGYEIQEEVGRGGIGIVLRCRDLKLGREIVIKVLRPEHQDDPALIQRFLEEAQIGGQLQHPGIVPVHELGRFPDQRPYFTMKLIEGQTLADLLQTRTDPLQDLPRFLGHFAQVCQTLAYAHSRGVIHRDLKPANIMVGAFGEVQVMDWGFAKVLDPARAAGPVSVPSAPETARRVETLRRVTARQSSQAGVVFGTWAYMPPEQALGRVDELDERCDVFGLGAILCEILTGKPPYVAAGWEVPLQAAGGELGEAWQRLERCGADQELVALAKACLAREREHRPRNAAVLAEAVTAYQASVQQRLRRAELERTAAQARAAEERKRRRLLVGLGTVVTVALVLGTAAAVYWQQQRQRAREQAEAGLTQAAELRQDYRFRDAEAMLKQVRGWANQAADRQLQQRVAQAEADLKLARDLDGVRQEAMTLVDGKWDPGRVRTLYPEVLARHGLDVLEGDLDELAQTIRGSTVRESFVAALDDWARTETDPERAQRLLRLANLADEPDPWRQAVRQAFVQWDGRRLRQLMVGTGKGKPTLGVVLLAMSFPKEWEEPTGLLRRMQLERPGDFWFSFALSNRLHEQKKYQEAAQYCLVTVALRRDSGPAHINLGLALKAKGDVDGAIRCYSTALACDPKFAKAHTALGVALKDKGDVEGAIRCWRTAIDYDPKDGSAHSNLGATLYDRGDIQGAIGSYRAAIDCNPKDAEAHCNMGNALKAKGDVAGAIRCWRTAIEVNPKLPQAHNNLGTALKERGDRAGAIRCWRTAIEIDPKYAPAHYGLGDALKEKGDMAGAIRCWRTAIEVDPTFAPAHYNLGVALHAKKDLEGAIRCWRTAIKLNPKLAQAHVNLGNALYGKDDLEGAIRCYRAAIELDPKLAQAHGAMGLTLLKQGRFAEARQECGRALKLLSVLHPLHSVVSQQLKQCEQLLALEEKLPAVLTGKAKPADAAERLALAFLCQQYKRLYAASAHFYADAFAEQPRLADDLRTYPRYNAACAAALAAAGKGVDAGKLDDKERARLRQQALDWLRDDLKAQAKQLKSWWPGQAEQARKTLEHWQQDMDLTAVRDAKALAALPEKERAAWQKLWADVNALRKKVEKKE